MHESRRWTRGFVHLFDVFHFRLTKQLMAFCRIGSVLHFERNGTFIRDMQIHRHRDLATVHPLMLQALPADLLIKQEIPFVSELASPRNTLFSRSEDLDFFSDYLMRTVAGIVDRQSVSLQQLWIQQRTSRVLGRSSSRWLLVDQRRCARTLLQGMRYALLLQIFRELHKLRRQLFPGDFVSTGTRAAVYPEHAQLVIPFRRLARRRSSVALALWAFQRWRLIETITSRHHFGRAIACLESHYAGGYHNEAWKHRRLIMKFHIRYYIIIRKSCNLFPLPKFSQRTFALA